MNARAYYNEIDPFAAAWLRELVADGLLPAGDVDERSIVDVEPRDLAGYSACHWFAGIGGWAYALRLAGWPDDRPVWTGSCPCQPLSSAGRRQGDLDERHLWPAFQRLIAECSPPVVFGEQVASKDGREWFAAVRADLEALGYACGAADLCAAGVGAPHIRQRLFWVADSDRQRQRGVDALQRSSAQGRNSADQPQAAGRGKTCRVGDGTGLEGCDPQTLGDQRTTPQRAGARGPWSDVKWLPCRDGKARPTQPGLFPLAHGTPARVGRLRGYGNAIVPQVAAEFIGAMMDLDPRPFSPAPDRADARGLA